MAMDFFDGCIGTSELTKDPLKEGYFSVQQIINFPVHIKPQEDHLTTMP